MCNNIYCISFCYIVCNFSKNKNLLIKFSACSPGVESFLICIVRSKNININNNFHSISNCTLYVQLPERRSAIVDISVSNTFSINCVVCPYCSIIRLVMAKVNLS